MYIDVYRYQSCYICTSSDTPVVVIKLIAGYNLPVTDKVLQNSDPFFVFEVKPDTSVGGTQKQRSTHKPRTLNPRWYSLYYCSRHVLCTALPSPFPHQLSITPPQGPSAALSIHNCRSGILQDFNSSVSAHVLNITFNDIM